MDDVFLIGAQQGVKGDRFGRRLHAQERLDAKTHHLVGLPRALQRHPDAQQPGLTQGDGLLQGPPDADPVVRVLEAQGREIRQAVGQEGALRLGKGGGQVLQEGLTGVEEVFQIPPDGLR